MYLKFSLIFNINEKRFRDYDLKVKQITEEISDTQSCKICFDKTMNVLLNPCRHVAFCLKCATNLT